MSKDDQKVQEKSVDTTLTIALTLAVKPNTTKNIISQLQHYFSMHDEVKLTELYTDN
jgi:hypothetical protein